VWEYIPLQRHDPVGRELEDVQPPIAHEAKVRRRRDGEAVVEEGRVLDRAAVEALGAKLQHRRSIGGLVRRAGGRGER